MRDPMDPILQQEEQRRLRVQLIWRLGFAVALIAAVLGVIIWLDRERENTTPTLEASVPMRIAPPVAMPSEIASEVSSEAPVDESIASEPAPASEPAAAITTSEPTSPQTSATPQAITPATATLQATTRQQTTTRPEPSRILATPARPLIILPQKPAPAEIQKPAAPARPAMPTSQYTIQAGAFLHSSNAEKLLQQLQSAGIPAYLETRVQIGPFSSKAEADAAMAKLKQMGITPVLNNRH